ncbi:MAG: DUF5906 domain-containing protein [Bacteroidia bacterium]|nr:DUF5906 domain-containing protein [Bacteroidia bacterium]
MTTYCAKRLSELGINYSWNKVEIPDDSPRGKREIEIFQADSDDNIQINYLALTGGIQHYEKGRWRKETPYVVTRLKDPVNGHKYINPAETAQQIFLTPKLIQQYQEGSSINTLYLTEGQFKVAAAEVHLGLNFAGISGIWGFREDKVKLRETLLAIIKTCRVKCLVLLLDADCLQVKPEPEKDLSTRLKSFCGAVNAFREVVLPLGIDALFMHIHERHETDAKGIDDLLVKYSKEEDQGELYKELHRSPIFGTDGRFIRSFDLSKMDAKAVKAYFKLSNVSEFYKAYKELLKDDEFIWNQWSYKYDEKKEKPIRTYGEKNPDNTPYRFIGVNLFKIQMKPWPDGTHRSILTKWSVDSVKREHSAKYLATIPTYEGFTVIPDNLNYKRAIDGFYNRYEPVPHQADEGPCKHTLKFIKHIFGKQYEYGLDYLQILYTKPAERLPILCPISKERKTGKSTLLNWLKAIYPLQMGIYQNHDLDSEFNDDWVGKLIIAIDETSLSLDPEATEKFKFWNFAHSIFTAAKGVDRQETPFFSKFILTSNKEKNFLPIEEAEDRFWVIKVPAFSGKEDTELLDKLIEEIPAFLHYLLNREMKTEKKTRMWFTKEQIYTDALQAVVEKSRGSVEKEIREIIRDALQDFLYEIKREFEETCVRFTREDLITKLRELGTRTTKTDISDILRDTWKLDNPENKRYRVYSWRSLGEKDEFYYETQRGRYYTFEAAQFLTQEEIDQVLNPLEPTSDIPPF